jgi:uncharacterized protein
LNETPITMRVVVDTNVVVSALLKRGSVPDRALACAWASATVLYDTRIAAEYRDVLMRPKLGGIDRAHVEAFLATLLARGHDLGAVTPWDGPMGDADDRIFVEVALAGHADAIVTGNLRDYPNDLGFEVLPPATLLARLENVRP